MSGNELIKPEEIQCRIYSIRGVQVMLDRDLALLYEVKAIRLREQVKRNTNRFPPDFMFRLTESEVDLMVSQNAIPSKKHLGGHLPYVFTEQGVAALSSVLTSERAVDVSIQIMRAFVAMRRFIMSNVQVFQRLDNLELKQMETDKKMEIVLNAIESRDILPKQGIFFNGQVFDAYTFVSDLFKSARRSIVIIDNYLDDSVLIHLTKRKKNVRITLLTRNISGSLALDVKKFNEQYPPIEIQEFRNAHDRFIVIDNTDIYHFGASLKDLGKKWFAFSKMDIGAVEMLARLEEIKA
ncbi:MAG: ORF6N domain-containing protein [Methanosarcinaceae archaeon]|nr:ORF6N domain-containing protein [Methanosarcinaceae archaeon]